MKLFTLLGSAEMEAVALNGTRFVKVTFSKDAVIYLPPESAEAISKHLLSAGHALAVAAVCSREGPEYGR